MPDSCDFFRRHLRRAWRELERALQDVDAETAGLGARADWRRYRYGTGLDGSIEGIVAHVAYWKHALADALGANPAGEPEDPPNGWEARLAWLEEGHARLEACCACLAVLELNRTIVLGGQPLTIDDALMVLIEHDHYHAGQINLLRQQMGHVFTDAGG